MSTAARPVELSVVVPVYQEEQTLPMFFTRIRPVLESITPDYELIFVVDPGRDRTEDLLRAEAAKDDRVRVLLMTRRWGQPACTAAGLEHSRGKAVVPIDVDLQDPPELIQAMYAKWLEGYEVVMAQRISRKGETLPKRVVSYVGYWIIDRIADVPIPRNTGDFRLLDRRVVQALGTLRETHGFLRGLVAFVGYKQCTIPYERDERKGGRSKYSQITGSLRIGLNGIVAFSSKPLTLATVFGFACAGLSVLTGLAYVIRLVVLGRGMMTGLAPIMLMVTFLGGVQLICFGIMGEYIGRIYEEVRQRPKYMVATKLNFPDNT
jgi:glycosyltransferase involved in cell wall biosynthesis